MSLFSEQQSLRLSCLRSLLRPIARFCFRNAHSIQEVHQELKLAFLEEAERELKRARSKVNTSRLSALTGLNRRDINELEKQALRSPAESSEKNLLGRIMLQWEQTKEFQTGAGKPKTLKYKGENNEFRNLVESVSKNLHAGTILFELERANLVEKTSRGVKPAAPMYSYFQDPRGGYELIAKDIDALIRAGEQNLRATEARNQLHILTHFDNLFQSDMPEIRKWVVKEGKKFHQRARDYLSKRDKDTSPDVSREQEPAGGEVLLGAHGFVAIDGKPVE